MAKKKENPEEKPKKTRKKKDDDGSSKKQKKDSSTDIEKEVKIDKKIKKKILDDEKKKIEAHAKKLALQLATQSQLQTQIELTDEQKEAVLLIASGYSYKETSDRVGVSLVKIEEWLKVPEFSRQLNEYTIKEGVSDKNDRIRKQKRIVEEMYNTLLKKISEKKLDEIPITALNDMLLKHSQRLDTLVDKKEEDLGKRDITVMILAHTKENFGKDYKDIEEMFKEDMDKYQVIDVEAEELNE